MKKLLAGMAAVAMFASCSQNEEFEKVEQKAEIKFSSVVTRATELTTTGLEDVGFQVYAYNTQTSDMADGVVLPASAWVNGAATYDKTNSVWSVAGGPYYWPLTDKLQFFAYSPTAGVTYTVPVGVDAGYPKFTYSVDASAANQKDLVISSVLNATKNKSAATADVSFSFKHALTQINIQVIQESTDYTYEFDANPITISGIKGEGTFTYTGANTGTWKANVDATDANYIYTLGTFTNGTSAVVTENALMLIPQDITNAKISIMYKTKKDGSYVFEGTKDIPLKSTTAWEFGTKILYKLTLPVGAEDIKFKAEASEWTDQVEESASGTPNA